MTAGAADSSSFGLFSRFDLGGIFQAKLFAASEKNSAEKKGQ